MGRLGEGDTDPPTMAAQRRGRKAPYHPATLQRRIGDTVKSGVLFSCPGLSLPGDTDANSGWCFSFRAFSSGTAGQEAGVPVFLEEETDVERGEAAGPLESGPEGRTGTHCRGLSPEPELTSLPWLDAGARGS